MVKVIVRILFICIATILLNFVYQVFFTLEKFHAQPPSMMPIPPLNLPIFVLIAFCLGTLFEKFVMKSKWGFVLLIGLFLSLCFYMSATFIENKYEHSYVHYYEMTGHTNLLALKEYKERPGNYIVLSKALRAEGFKITSIEDGYTEKGDLLNTTEPYKKKVYFINNEHYVIFDWEEQIITNTADQQTMYEHLLKQYDSLKNYTSNDFLYDSHVMIIDGTGYQIQPGLDDTFKFSVN